MYNFDANIHLYFMGALCRAAFLKEGSWRCVTERTEFKMTALKGISAFFGGELSTNFPWGMATLERATLFVRVCVCARSTAFPWGRFNFSSTKSVPCLKKKKKLFGVPRS